VKIVRDDGTEMVLTYGDRRLVVNGLYAEVGRLYRSSYDTDTAYENMAIAESRRLEGIAGFVMKP